MSAATHVPANETLSERGKGAAGRPPASAIKRHARSRISACWFPVISGLGGSSTWTASGSVANLIGPHRLSEAFVKTLKRDYARVTILPDADTILTLLPTWIEDYCEVHPHSGLKFRSPRELIRLSA